MITGLDGSMWSAVTDPAAMVNTNPPVEICLWRGYDGWRDDTKFVQHRNQMRGLTNPSGAVLWGAYLFLGYTSSTESGMTIMTITAARGDAQASNFWSLITAGGIEWQVPPAIDVEHNSFMDDAGHVQRWPMPTVQQYADTYLLPAIRKLRDLSGRMPILYTNPDRVLHYLSTLFGNAAYQDIFDCPLWIADYNPIKPGGSYAWQTAVSKYFPKWLIHQTRGSVSNWPGVSNIDLNRCQGTRAQWKAWCKDATMPLPQEGATDPVPPDPTPDPTPDPQPIPGDLIDAIARIQAKLDVIGADVTAIREHFRP